MTPSTMQLALAASRYYHPRLIQLIQQPQPEHDAAVRVVHKAEALVQDMRQALAQAEQQLAQTQVQLQQTIPAQQERWQLVQQLREMQRACWNRSLSAELSGLILGKTSRYNVRMVSVSCPLLRDFFFTMLVRCSQRCVDWWSSDAGEVSC